MTTRIIPVKMGLGQCYVLQSDGVMMIDAGSPGTLRCLTESLERSQIPVKKLDLLVLTHGHWDHIGCAKAIKALTGAKIALHEREAAWLEQGLTPPPPPGVTLWGRLLCRLLAKSMRPYVETTPVDIKMDNHDWSLSDHGIPGRVIHTPGHSSGSVSILLESGDVFVGDLALSLFPLRLTPGLPIFADNTKQVKESWQRLLTEGAKTVYPAHGKPFSAELIRKQI